MRYFAILFALFFVTRVGAQTRVEGAIIDQGSGETLVGATVMIKATLEGTTTDLDGRFSFDTKEQLPVQLTISYIGYETQLVEYTGKEKKFKVQLTPSATMLEQFEIADMRISDKQKQEPLTVERMDVLAIKETPSDNFYDGLAALKGVDITAASLGFKVINTRGFNSTSPVRSLQLIDGVDNQSPGLNFSLGNFLGSSDLDVMAVDIIAGASSAFYGPGAFNGVVNMTTKNPFDFQGLSFSSKIGERNMSEYAFRWAQAIKNKKGNAKLAYKVNFFYMKAIDWYAENYDPITDSEVAENNPGGFDAVNVYGDEEFEDYTDQQSKIEAPGLGVYHRTGYKEVDIANYNTENLKFNTAVHYRITDSIEAHYVFNYSTGTTIYQGDNRYSLKDIQFRQHHAQIGKKDKWFVRAYLTNEDAGKSYDIVTTALRLTEDVERITPSSSEPWFTTYRNQWKTTYGRQIKRLEGYPNLKDSAINNDYEKWELAYDQFMEGIQDSLVVWHDINRTITNNDPRAGDSIYVPGTARFDSAFNDIRTRKFTQGGSRFFDRSALYHVQGEYRFELLDKRLDLVVGGNYRWYRPNSQGTIFQDTMTYERSVDDSGNVVLTDSSYRVITNEEFGAYLGLGSAFFEKKLRLNATLRMDKNQNFSYLFSPALSAVFSPNVNHTFRATFSSAVRNPTLADQYLYYNVGRAILLGNLGGFDSLITTSSFISYLGTLNTDSLDYFNADPIRPERVKTIEAGYRGTWWNKVYVDASAYYSWYRDFIGYVIGVSSGFNSFNFPVNPQVYRLAANAEGLVFTQGLNIGANYYYAKKHGLNANYSYNQLISGDDDPIIPAFNTPKHKYNVGISGRDIKLKFLNFGQWGYSVNYRWVDGFRFEGSPQFTGDITAYGMLNAQVNYSVPKWYLTLKCGASNVLNNRVYQVYGGPRVGRLAYISLTFDWNKHN